MQRACIYLIKSGKYLKVGKSTNFERRWNQYRTHNPDLKLVGKREVPDSLMDAFEKDIHTRFRYLRHNLEWFEYDQKIVNYVMKAPLPGDVWHLIPHIGAIGAACGLLVFFIIGLTFSGQVNLQNLTQTPKSQVEEGPPPVQGAGSPPVQGTESSPKKKDFESLSWDDRGHHFDIKRSASGHGVDLFVDGKFEKGFEGTGSAVIYEDHIYGSQSGK